MRKKYELYRILACPLKITKQVQKLKVCYKKTGAQTPTGFMKSKSPIPPNLGRRLSIICFKHFIWSIGAEKVRAVKNITMSTENYQTSAKTYSMLQKTRAQTPTGFMKSKPPIPPNLGRRLSIICLKHFILTRKNSV